MVTTAHITSLRALALAALALAGASLLHPTPASASYGWPVRPFDRQHPVRGFFGDPRIDDASHTGSLHFGVDVVAANGTPVYATLTGRASIHSRHRSTVTVSAGGGRVFEYWHVVPAVRNGQWVEAYRTVVGHVEAPWAHVHFSETVGGRYVNPLRPGAMAPYVDRTRPQPTGLTAERLSMPLGKLGLAGKVDLVAQVRDWMPLEAPAPWTGKPVMPAVVRWRLVGRRGRATAWRTAVDFRLSLPASGFRGVYARWTRQNKPWRAGRYRVYLARGLDTRGLPDGPYRVDVEVADTGGNRSRRSELVVVRNATPMRSADHEDGDEEVGDASRGLAQAAVDARSVVASFARRSYAPGEVAVLRIRRRYPATRVEILHVGPERELTVGNETMRGIRVAAPVRLAAGSRSVRVRIGDWPSGLFAARLTTTRGRVGFAPFVLRPARLGAHRVAVVQPTNTWQAYNFRDGDGDGLPESWYRNRSSNTVDTTRPFLDRGVPPHFRRYDLGFLRWLSRSGKRVDMLAQEDLERVPGDRLARLYDLIVFPGHHEYVTEAEYDAVQRFRDLGGNLAFLSANNFFWRVDRRGERLRRIAMWRDLGRPEAALVGVQYIDWNHDRYPNRPYAVVGARRAPWLFARTGMRNGDGLGYFGIEVDGRTASSPRGVQVVATMPNAFGTGRAAEMTYYETAAGARVFAAGAFTMAGPQARRPVFARMLENLWARLAPRVRPV